MWFTSDTHFGHKNIIIYSQRPFVDVQEMNEKLVLAWNSVVKPEDEVWHLGDVAMGNLEESLENIKLLNGKKFLIPGNHDRCWEGNKKPSQKEKYEEVGFTVLSSEMILRVEEKALVISHFPYEGDSHDKDRYEKNRPVDEGKWLLHGHVHEKWRQKGRMLNVGTDVWGYKPVHLETLKKMIEEGEKNLDRNGQDF